MNKYLLFLCGLLAATNIEAAGHTVTQITDNTYNDEYARINARGDVVWSAWVNTTDTGGTLFEYNAETKVTTQISSGNAFYDSHQLNNKGDVVWTATDGLDQEIYLYRAATQTVTALTNNDTDDTNPQISDNGDVSWLEQSGSTASNALLWRYDAASMTASVVAFAGATRQGNQTMNAKGDIAWNAVLVDSQQVLLYNAATGTTSNISNNEGAIHSNQRLTDNGDVVWETYDSLTSQQGIMYYKAADQSVLPLAADVGAHVFGAHGNAVWASGLNSTYTLSTFDPTSGTTKVIATETTSYGPNLAGISARGDVAWSLISGTSWISRVYNAQTNAIVDLTNTQGYGTYELHLADNGDAMWSLWDGTDYEVYSYQVDSGAMTQLSDNLVNDGIASLNGAGAIVWNRFDASDSELMLAVKNTTPSVKPLAIDVKRLVLKKAYAGLKADFTFDGIPEINEAIAISVDGVSLLNIPFGDFNSKGKGFYQYKSKETFAVINFAAGIIVLETRNNGVAAIGARSSANVTISFGPSTATFAYTLR